MRENDLKRKGRQVNQTREILKERKRFGGIGGRYGQSGRNGQTKRLIHLLNNPSPHVKKKKTKEFCEVVGLEEGKVGSGHPCLRSKDRTLSSSERLEGTD